MNSTTRSCSPSPIRHVRPSSYSRAAPKLPSSARNVPCCRNVTEPLEDFPDLRSEDIPQIELIRSMINYKTSYMYNGNNESANNYESQFDIPDFETLYFQEHHRVRELEVELKQLKLAFDKVIRDKQVMQNNYETFIAEMQAEQNEFRNLEFKLHEVDDWRRKLEEQVRKLTIENELLRAREESTSQSLFAQLKSKMKEYNFEKSTLLSQLENFQSEITELKDKMEDMKQQHIIEQDNYERVVDHLLKENEELRGAAAKCVIEKPSNQLSVIHPAYSPGTINSRDRTFVAVYDDGKNLELHNQPQIVQTYGEAMANERHEKSMDQSTIAPSIDSINDPMYSPYRTFKLKAEDIRETLNEAANKRNLNQQNTTTILVNQKFSDIYASQDPTLQQNLHPDSNVAILSPVPSNAIKPESSPVRKRIRLDDRLPSVNNTPSVVKIEPVVIKAENNEQLHQKSILMSTMSFTKKIETKYEECESLNVSKELKPSELPSLISSRQDQPVTSTIRVVANYQAKD